MKSTLARPAATAAAFLLCAMVGLDAQADLVFRFHNGSKIKTKGIMQNVGIVWLQPGQVETVVKKGTFLNGGGWTVSSTKLGGSWVANFEALDNSGVQYCVWDIGSTKASFVDNEKHQTTLSVKLRTQAPGFQCIHGGQIGYVLLGDVGATIDFVIKQGN